jgi:hypothetical protein
MWIGVDRRTRLPHGTTALTWHAEPRGQRQGSAVETPIPQRTIDTDAAPHVESAEVLLAPSTAGISQIAASSLVAIDVRAAPGIHVETVIDVPGARGATSPDTTYYSFVAGLRGLVWAIAVLVLTVGLLSFAVASIDRASSRRQELVSLQLVGVRPRTLRRAQWMEISAPLALGCVAAISCGLLAGVTFLSFGSIIGQTPWRPTLVLAAVAVTGSLLVAASTVLVASPPIRPETIRAE